MNYCFKATETFWRNFYGLRPSQKKSVRQAWEIFKQNPFDSRLHTHKIHHLSARYKRIVYAVVIESNLRSIFYMDGDRIVTMDIGSHELYKP